jgi:hypothetical protein
MSDLLPIRVRLDVYGRDVLVERDVKGWSAFYVSAEGKRRVAEDIIIPGRVREEELVQYIADLCHEWAEPGYPEVRVRG